MHDLPTETVTFLFTDIEGSTKLWEQYPEVMRAALARHDALLRQTIQQHNGYIFKTVGDAFCAAFSTAADALYAALAAQQALHKETWPQQIGTLRVRMALHTGSAEERDGDYFGPPVNRVARLLSIGHGEQVLLTQVTSDLLIPFLSEECSLQDMSSHRLKDLQQPEHVWQLLHPALPSEFPPMRSLQAFANNLPIQSTSFIGREQEMKEVKALFSSTRLLTLTGAGGCGKTRLALQMAADLVEDYPDGVWLVELAPLAEASLVPQTVATALGLREDPSCSLTETLTDYLRSKTLLLILDNCEHLVEACASLANILLRACPRVKFLATSREPLNIAGEHPWRIPSLLPPDPAHLPSEERDLPAILAENDAIRLFVERASTQRADFRLNTQNARAIAQVCHRLDGIPLALELAAARVRALTAEQIAARLDDRFKLLTGGNRTALPRQQTLRALLDWSYELLKEQERTLLHRLSVFAGGWTLEAAETVCSGEGIEDWEVLDLLTSLVDKSLVVFEEVEREAGGRYRLLETIRQYAQERLRATGEEPELQGQHRDFFLMLAEEADLHLRSAKQAVWLDRLETEHDNLRSALGACQAIGEAGAEAGLRLCGALQQFWWTRGHLSEGREWTAAALSQEGSEERTKWRAKVLNGAGALARMQGDYTAARAFHEQCLAICREIGDQQGIANSLNSLGSVAYERDDNASARTFYEESLSLFQEIGDQLGIATVLGNLGVVALYQGDNASARTFYEESLAIRREIGDRQGIAIALANLGHVAQNLGDNASSRAFYEESLAVQRDIGDRPSIANSLIGLGCVAYYQGDYIMARAFFEESLAIRREIGDRQGIANALNNLGGVALNQGDYASARAFHEQSLAIYEEIGNRLGIAYCLENCAALASAQEQPERAARLWGVAEALREVIGALLSPNQREEYDGKIAEARAALGEDAFVAAWTEGCAMSMEQAIEYALQELGDA
jgi:predicted ATPase/class 3 adenylate cyclase